MYALNASTGAKLWSYTTTVMLPRPPWPTGWSISAPLMGTCTALNASTGAMLWSYTTGEAVASSPAVANGVVYIGSNDGNVYALNAITGACCGAFQHWKPLASSPAVANGVVYIWLPTASCTPERRHRRKAVERSAVLLDRSHSGGGVVYIQYWTLQ